MGRKQTMTVVIKPGTFAPLGPRGSLGHTPVHIGRVTTGINKGKTYPYAGAKRGGTPPAEPEGFSLLRRTKRFVLVRDA